jgi:hypothetical protein
MSTAPTPSHLSEERSDDGTTANVVDDKEKVVNGDANGHGHGYVPDDQPGGKWKRLETHEIPHK